VREVADETPNGFQVRYTNKEIMETIRSLESHIQGLERRVDSVLGENVDLRTRVRGLELKFYGVLAGLVGAVVILFRLGGVT
jgi:hypothetical protein